MIYREILSRPDITLYAYITIQGIPEAWTPVGETRAFVGLTVRPIIASRSIRVQYGTIDPLRGIASPGTLSLELLDAGGYIAGLLDRGIETELTADLSYDEEDTIHVASTEGMPDVGAVHIHRERIAYTGRTETTLIGLTRATYDDTGAVSHLITIPTGLESDGITATVRVGTTPWRLEGRWITLWAICLDPGGYPIADSDGTYTWPIWRGIVTACPPSPDGIMYRIEAETPERLIADDPPVSGIYGRLITGTSAQGSGGAQPWAAYDVPIWIPWDRRFIELRIDTDAPSCPYAGTTQVIQLLTENHGQWRTLGQIAQAIQDGLDAATYPAIQWTVSVQIVQVYWSDNPDQIECYMTIEATDPWPYESGYLRLTITQGVHTAWQQLGWVGEHVATSWVQTDEVPFSAFGFASDQLPADVCILPEDTEIPCVTAGPLAPTAGWVRIGDEVIAYSDIVATQYIEGMQAIVLRGCVRGYAGTVAKAYEHRLGQGTSAEVRTVQPTYCVGGGDTIGAETPDASIWISALKILTGSAGTSSGEWSAWPGLGIPTSVIDIAAIEALAALPPLAGPMYGEIRSVRQYLSDAIALEGYCLAARPTAGGCMLTPVRTGCVTADEAAIDVTIDASGAIRVQGGLAEVVNRVTVSGPRAEAHYTDASSVAAYGVRQEVTYDLPTADPVAGVALLTPAARRIFALRAHPDAVTISASIDATGRMIAPGDVISLTLPSAALSGLYRVLSAQTQIRGRGGIEIEAVRADMWVGGLYAPTTIIEAIDGREITVSAGTGRWYRVGATLRISDPQDWEDYRSPRLDAVDGDVLKVSDATGISVGDVVEHLSLTTAIGEERYIWLVADTYVWGD